MSRWEQEEAEQEEAEQEEAEQRAYEKHMQAMYDEQHQMQQLAEEAAWLRGEVKRLKAENEVLRGERPAVVAWLREEERLYEKHWWLHVASSLRRLCDIIERGEHRREEER